MAVLLTSPPSMRSRCFGLGVLLSSMASLALSLLFTRIFSVTMYYHFAFFLISLALLGIAISGVCVSILPGIFRPERMVAWAGLFAILAAPLAALALGVAVSNPMSVDLKQENLVRLTKLYATTALPFLASGFSITLAITSAREHIGRVYACDLIGAALGCLLTIGLLGALGGPAAVLAAGALSAVAGAALALSSEHRLGRPLAIVGALVAVGTGLLGLEQSRSHRPFKIAQTTKFLREDQVIFEKWNALSRVTVSRTSAPDYQWLHIDADAATRMFSSSVVHGNLEAPRRFSEIRVASLVYALRKEGPALIIGPGGGPDVLSALRAGVPRVLGVEVNPIIVDDVMRGAFAGYDGDLYRDPRVHVVVDDGRSYIRRSQERYSSIQATLVDTWAASTAGAFTLTENNLYTAEAFTEYLSHLDPQGVLSMTRWYTQPPREFLRLVALGRAGLEALDVVAAEIAQHFFVAADDRLATLLVKRTPFLPAELAALQAECAASRLRVLFSPEAPGGDPISGLLGAAHAGTFAETLPYDVSPTTDDRPFFFYTLRRNELPGLLARLGNLERNNLGLAMLQIVLVLSLVLTLVLVVAPLVLLRRGALVEQRRSKLTILAYFLMLGLGYILVELGLMQRFILFLGHPLYALALVLAVLLAATGLGSALSARLGPHWGEARTIRTAIFCLSIVLVLYMIGLGPLFRALLGLPLGARCLTAGLLVGVLGLLMGTLLPAGVRMATRHGADLVAWAWGLNGATSVVGSIVAVILSMQFGFRVTLGAGLVCYLIGALLVRRTAD